MTANNDRWIPITIWQVDTKQSHEIEIRHRSHSAPSRAAAEAWGREPNITSLTLLENGELQARIWNGKVERIDQKDVVIRELTKPMEERGVPFIPDPSTPEGLARIKATFTDPAYQVTEENYTIVALSLAELAALPGATGKLGSLAYSVEQDA